MNRETLPVIFRAERSGEYKGQVTAVFPTVPGTYDPASATCYTHIGQHSSCWPGWYFKTRRATEEEAAPLLRELRGIYETGPDAVTIKPVQRWTQRHDEARREALRQCYV